MGQAVVGGLTGAVSGFIQGGPTGALIYGALGFAGAALHKALRPEQKGTGYTVNQRGAALPRQVVYGRTKVGGAIIFDDAHGTDNKYLSRIIAFADHEIDSFAEIYLDDYRLTLSGDEVTSAQQIDEKGNNVGSATTKFNGKVKIRKVLGNHTASLNGAASWFSTNWTSDHKLLGVAHLAIRFEYADDVYDHGLPDISAIVKGKKVYDPVADSTSWTQNPALIIRDYLINEDYGLAEDATVMYDGASGDDTGLPTFRNARDLCFDFLDDSVAVTAGSFVIGSSYEITSVGTTDFTAIGASANTVGTTFIATGEGSGTGKAGPRLYTCNGSFTTNMTPLDILSNLLSSCAGYLWYSQGKWRLRAGKYIAPTVTLAEDDLRSTINISTRHSRRENFNSVRGTFRGRQTNFQETDYTAVTDSAFVTTDGGYEQNLDYSLAFTDTSEMCRRLATIVLERNRSQITLQADFGMTAFNLQVADIVQITNTRFGWTDKLFEVVTWGMSIEAMEPRISLTLREITASTYDQVLDTDVFELDNTSLPGALGAVAVTATAVTGELIDTENVVDKAISEAEFYQKGGTTVNTNTVVATDSMNYEGSGNVQIIWSVVAESENDDGNARIRFDLQRQIGSGSWTTLRTYDNLVFRHRTPMTAVYGDNPGASAATVSYRLLGTEKAVQFVYAGANTTLSNLTLLELKK